MVLRQPVLFIAQSLPHFDQEHLNLQRCPAQSITEGLPRQTIQAPHDYIAHNVATLLKALLLCPGTDGTFEALAPDVCEAGLDELRFDRAHGVEVGAEAGHALVEIANEVAPGEWTTTRVVVAAVDVLELVDLDVASRLQVPKGIKGESMS